MSAPLMPEPKNAAELLAQLQDSIEFRRQSLRTACEPLAELMATLQAIVPESATAPYDIALARKRLMEPLPEILHSLRLVDEMLKNLGGGYARLVEMEILIKGGTSNG